MVNRFNRSRILNLIELSVQLPFESTSFVAEASVESCPKINAINVDTNAHQTTFFNPDCRKKFRCESVFVVERCDLLFLQIKY